MTEFPELKPENSRDTFFEDLIMKRTRGKGVDFTLNSLPRDKLLASITCGERGIFWKLGNSIRQTIIKLDLGAFVKELIFYIKFSLELK